MVGGELRNGGWAEIFEAGNGVLVCFYEGLRGVPYAHVSIDILLSGTGLQRIDSPRFANFCGWPVRWDPFARTGNEVIPLPDSNLW